jgi:cellulose synthase/poly-beta-1,6-N-acetylglucosamine synthase-like glycosyltransferase
MRKKLTVTVGIPAYNEEANIANLLKSILAQKQDNYKLEKIIVISDGSTDSTVNKAKSIKSIRLDVLDEKKQKGKSYRLNQMFKLNKSDILVLLDADSLLHKNALTEITKQFKAKKYGLVAGKQKMVGSKTLIEKALTAREYILSSVIAEWNSGKNIYAFRGGFMGLKNSLARRLHVPNTSGNDAHIYLSAKKIGYEVHYANKAVAYFKSPVTFQDHYRQSSRFVISQSRMENIFSNQVKKEYQIPLNVLAKAFFKSMFKMPINTLVYLGLHTITSIKIVVRKEEMSSRGIWKTSKSTKKLSFKIN